MARHIQSSFSAGELDPALHERTTFDKYKAGLKTLRNAVIGKTGRVISRAGTVYNRATKSPVLTTGTFTADHTTETFTQASHPYRTGDRVWVSSDTTLPSGLSASTDYFVVITSSNIGNTFKLATSLANALAGTTLAIADNGTGTHTITPQDDVDKECILYSPPYTDYMIEFGHGYLRTHDVSAGTYVEAYHYYTEDDLPYVHFVPNGLYVYIFVDGKFAKRLTLSSGAIASGTILGSNPIDPPSETSRVIGGTGYAIRYAVTQVVNGEESYAYELSVGAGKLPIAVTEKNTLVLDCTNESSATEVRVYRRPDQGIAYGFIGAVAVSGGAATFYDYGEDADYTHNPPTILEDHYQSVGFNPKTGIFYQQRLVVTNWNNDEIIDASRTGYPTNFFRDYPYSDDSALRFKCGTKGNAKVLHFVDNGGLLAFTTVGIYQSGGALTPTNLAMDKKGTWVSDDKVPPLEVPGGLLFIDRETNTVRNLIYSNEAGGYPADEVSIFSDHLFRNRRVKSWAFQGGSIPLVWVVFSDGDAAGFTYQREHQMQAWSRHDTDGLFEAVTVVKDLDGQDVVYFVVNRDGVRTIETLSDRFAEDFKDLVCMDSAVTFKHELIGTSGAVVTVAPVVTDDWAGQLTITSDTDIFTNSADQQAVGNFLKWFDSDGSGIEFEIDTYTSNKILVVTPNAEFPSEQATITELYKVYSELTGLDHMEDKLVSIVSDGYVIASPNNDKETYPEMRVDSGNISLSETQRGAIVHVGLPFTADVETLDIDTVEQKPALLTARLVSKIWLKVFDTRGLFIGYELQDNESVSNMTDAETREEDLETGNIGNAAQEPVTKRHEIIIRNDWNSSGRICLRQVDPLPFEILSIIPELMILDS